MKTNHYKYPTLSSLLLPTYPLRYSSLPLTILTPPLPHALHTDPPLLLPRPRTRLHRLHRQMRHLDRLLHILIVLEPQRHRSPFYSFFVRGAVGLADEVVGEGLGGFWYV